MWKKGKAKKTVPMVDEVKSGGDVLEDAGVSVVEQTVVRSSVADGISDGMQRSKVGSDSFNDLSSIAQSAETLHFLRTFEKIRKLRSPRSV